MYCVEHSLYIDVRFAVSLSPNKTIELEEKMVDPPFLCMSVTIFYIKPIIYHFLSNKKDRFIIVTMCKVLVPNLFVSVQHFFNPSLIDVFL